MKINNANIDLHLHPFRGKNSFSDVYNAIEKKNLDVIAAEELNSSIFPWVVSETKKLDPSSTIDETGVKFPNNRFLMNAREYDTKETLHVITVGYTLDSANENTPIEKIIDNALENEALVILDHPFVANKSKPVTAGHIDDKLADYVENICRQYDGQIGLEWNGYCLPWMRKGLQIGLNMIGHNIQYHDVNKKAIELSNKLKEEGINTPIIPDTDLHGRTKYHLNAIGTAGFTCDLEGDTPKEILSSMKDKIFSGEYEQRQK